MTKSSAGADLAIGSVMPLRSANSSCSITAAFATTGDGESVTIVAVDKSIVEAAIAVAGLRTRNSNPPMIL
ncbi:hypothetical protein [Symmachiella dynata]|uniref:hypothetical protein n=1 Tax=Symmachiella dynata TaxID=2527995 RepID=UPI001E2C4D44|nr:hypothetical protein [Symmachiella dynata]